MKENNEDYLVSDTTNRAATIGDVVLVINLLNKYSIDFSHFEIILE